MIIDRDDLQKERKAWEIAERFGISDKTVQALWKTGQLRYRVLPTRGVGLRRAKRSTFQDYINYQQGRNRKRGRTA